jgi:hypothetical protein
VVGSVRKEETMFADLPLALQLAFGMVVVFDGLIALVLLLTLPYLGYIKWLTRHGQMVEGTITNVTQKKQATKRGPIIDCYEVTWTDPRTQEARRPLIKYPAAIGLYRTRGGCCSGLRASHLFSTAHRALVGRLLAALAGMAGRSPAALPGRSAFQSFALGNHRGSLVFHPRAGQHLAEFSESAARARFSAGWVSHRLHRRLDWGSLHEEVIPEMERHSRDGAGVAGRVRVKKEDNTP